MSDFAGAVEIQADDGPFGDAVDERALPAVRALRRGRRLRRDRRCRIASRRPTRPGGPCDGWVLLRDRHGGGRGLRRLRREARPVSAPSSCWEHPTLPCRQQTQRSPAGAFCASARSRRCRRSGSTSASLSGWAAGWMQAVRRFERLFIRAPVTEARRLCELARCDGLSVLVSERALACASSTQAGWWSSVTAVGPTGSPVAPPRIRGRWVGRRQSNVRCPRRAGSLTPTALHRPRAASAASRPAPRCGRR